jgi:hypothetical protein
MTVKKPVVYKLLLLISLSFLVGCKKDGVWEPKGEYHSVGVEKTSKEYLIPRDLRDIIEADYLKFIRKENPKIVLPDAEILARIPREFLDVGIYLSSPSSGVLADSTSFELPRGGGEIDLKPVVKGKKGTFYLHFTTKRTQTPDVPLKNLHIYFMSETKAISIGDDKFGAGCYKYMDVTNQLVSGNSGAGLALNATDLRYLPVIGGVFYFVDFDPERKLFIAAVRMLDSRYPETVCLEPK